MCLLNFDTARLTPEKRGRFSARRHALSAGDNAGQNGKRQASAPHQGRQNSRCPQHRQWDGQQDEDGGQAYEVQAGDTLAGIAQANGTTPDVLMRLNPNLLPNNPGWD